MMPPAGEPMPARLARCRPRSLPAIGGNPSKPRCGWRMAPVCLCSVLVPAAIWLLPQDLTRDGRIALIVVALAVIGWSMTRIGDTAIAIASAVALAATGVIGAGELLGTLGHELIWLLVAAFVISAALRASGLLELLVAAVLSRLRTVRALLLGLTGVIAATALVIPSTTGRAALMLPVFGALAERVGNDRTVRALALLFPTVILLSAGGSLIGAGAHIVAVDFMVRAGNAPVDYLGWAAMALPFALLSCLLAAIAILLVFLTPQEASARLQAAPTRIGRPTWQQVSVASVVLLTVALWATAPLHGCSLALVALIGAAALLLPGIAPITAAAAFKTVDAELIVFLAMTLVMAEALSQSGADKWLAQSIVAAVPASIGHSTPVVVALVALISLLAHLVIVSRTARATVLIPALALPLAGLGHDPKLLILVTVLGTGFSQTLPASAKAVAIFAMSGSPSGRRTCTTGELVRLSGVLLPIMLALLMLFALAVWS
jgi:solute carrier family 13 (sodium-dependent dicarboxylate transporter), member 2/3/5